MKTSARSIATAERRAKAVEYRKAGMSYTTIADRLGYNSRQAAHWNVHRALEEIADKTSEDARDMRTLECERLDSLQLQLWGNLRQPGSTGVDLQVVDRLLKIQERRAKLLGLDENESKVAAAAVSVAASVHIQTAQLQDVMMAILRRLNLTDEQWGIVPGVVVEELEAVNPRKEAADEQDFGS